MGFLLILTLLYPVMLEGGGILSAMRILNQADNAPLNTITIYFTAVEALQAIGYLEQMLAEPDQHHFHLNDEEYQRDVTLTVYHSDNLDHYDERSRKLIIEGE